MSKGLIKSYYTSSMVGQGKRIFLLLIILKDVYVMVYKISIIWTPTIMMDIRSRLGYALNTKKV